MSARKVQVVQKILDDVYGPYTGPGWRPAAFSGRSRRYLWSDAFGVCNYISMHYAAGSKDQQYLDQADAVIDDVHETLGCYRGKDKKRLGAATDEHPLLGGLRIGKEDPDDDGQYFHYLTKWMFALNRMKIARDDDKYNRWAIELAESVHSKFVRVEGGRPRMFWKLSVDLSCPMTWSEGNLDPFDGYVTYRLLLEQSRNAMALQQEISEMKAMVARKYMVYSSSDELDLGEALWLCSWFPDDNWAQVVAHKSIACIDELYAEGRLARSQATRLMFREMGLTMGMRCAINLNAHDKWRARVDQLHDFWEDKLYTRDRDISPLMYASSVLPIVFEPNRGYFL